MTPHDGADRLAGSAATYYCAACLHAVPRSKTTRQVYRDGVAGAEVWLLRCPVCGLTLDADVVPRAEPVPSK